MNKLEKLEFIKKTIKEKELTAYKISKAIGVSSVGIQKILNDETKNPNNATLDLIVNYLYSLDKNLHDLTMHEPQPLYGEKTGYDIKIEQHQEEIKYRQGIIDLSSDKDLIEHHKKMIKLLEETIAIITAQALGRYLRTKK